MRGRIAAAGVAALILVAISPALGAPAASAAACPNEAFRTGPSAQLGECRAYEMVTPVETESATGVFPFGGAKVGPTGDEIYFNSQAAYAGAQGSAYDNPVIGARAGDDWDVHSIVGPQAAQYGVITGTTFAVSDDLRHSFLVSKEALAPNAIPGGSNIYVRDDRTGAYTTVAALPGNEAFHEWTNFGLTAIPFVGADADFSHVLIRSRFVLAPGGVLASPGGQANLYEFSEGQLRLAAPGASPAGVDDSGNVTEATPNVISTDGSRFYYLQRGNLYMHQDGQEAPVLVSADENGNPSGVDGGAFLGATPDGGIAFYRSAGSVYRFEAAAPPGERVTDLATVPAPEIKRAFVGEDGTSVYFTSTEALTPDAEPLGENEFGRKIGYDLYVWHGEPGQPGAIRYIGQSDSVRENNGEATIASVSANGRFFGLESDATVTPDAVEGSAESCPLESFGQRLQGRCLNVFLYSYDSNRLVCASCSGAPPSGDSILGGREARKESLSAPSAVLDDGEVFFDTTNALVPRDVNGTPDAYGWRDGTAQLFSTGTDPGRSNFIDASADGSDVFFSTPQPLVGRDDDRVADLYDARVEGGLPQGAPAAPPSCVPGIDCQPDIAAGPQPARPGTGTVGSAREGGACPALGSKARAAKKRSRALARRARVAKGRRAKALRRGAARQAKTAKRLGRRAGDCKGGGR